MQKHGEVVDYKKLQGKAYIQALQEKILEEAGEIDLVDKSNAAKELADLQEIIDCIADELNITKIEIQHLQEQKNKKAGSFKKGIMINTVEMREDNEWISYLASHPDRYPEIKQ